MSQFAMSQGRETETILLVDEDPETLQVLKSALNQPEYEIVTARSGPEALMALLNHQITLILMDVFMKTMDGYEVVRLIKQREKTRHIPIIFLAPAHQEHSQVIQAYGLGVVDSLQKPFEAEIVRAKVAFFSDLYRKSRLVRKEGVITQQNEQREQEHRLHEARVEGERRFHDLVEGISHGFVWSLDPVTRKFSYVSPRAGLILGYPLEQWKNEDGFWLNRIHPEDRDAMVRAIHDAEMGRDIGIDHRFISAQGDTVWLHSGVRLARKGTGAGVELRGLSVDITYMKQIENQLKDSVRMRDEFLSIASHELRTPLTPLLLQLQLIERTMQKGGAQALTPAKLSKALESWRRQVGRLSGLIEELLDVTRISAGRLVLETEDVDLCDLIEGVVENHRAELARAGCETQVSLPEQVSGHWDKSRIEQVLTNLLTNAIKYAPGKPVEIHLSEDAKNVVVEVRDQGDGIPVEKQRRIFERFERGGDSKNVSGLGLGLYIARNIVQAHKGTISVESTPGRGTKFRVVLPRHTQELACDFVAVGSA